MSHPYAYLALYFAAALAFPLLMIGAAQAWSRLFRVARPGPTKQDAYECGLASTGDAWIQFKAHYYLYALLFLVFDVEVVFLLPVAVAFTGLPTGALLAVLIFVLLLAEGLVWAWAKGHLQWS